MKIMTNITIFTIICCLCLVKTVPLDFSNQAAGSWASGTCATGQQQSPIDFAENVTYYPCEGNFQILELSPMIPTGSPLTIDSNGLFIFDVQGSIRIKIHEYEVDYPLSSCEFRLPSEHKINGKQYEMEFDCWFTPANAITQPTLVNLDRADNFGLTVLFESTKDETDFPEISDLEVGENVPNFNLRKLFDFDKGFYHYDGSNHGFGCGENVIWTVMKDPLKITYEQYYYLVENLSYFGESGNTYPLPYGNARQTQPIHGRWVYTCNFTRENPVDNFLDINEEIRERHHKHKRRGDRSHE